MLKKGVNFFILISILMVFTSFVSATSIFSDDFESGGLSGWTLTVNDSCTNWAAVTTTNGDHTARSGSWFAEVAPNCGPTEDPASRMERTISTSNYENITFTYYRRLHGLDASDCFRAKWYNGSNWFISEETCSSPVHDPTYVLGNFSLSASAANNPNFKIRFECTALTQTTEYCQVDDITITGNQMDNSVPNFSNYSENPTNNSAYSPGQFYELNVTINDSSAIDDVWISFNGVNYTNVVSRGNGVYSFNRTDLAAGTYNYFWWANDSLGNLGLSSTRTYVIAKATGSVSLFLNGNAGNLAITYLQTSNISVSTSYGSVSIYQNGTDISPDNNLNIARAAGYYNITAVSSGNQNYSSSSASYFLTINKATPSATLSNSTPWINSYGTSFTVGTSEGNSGDGDVSYVIYRDSISRGSGETVVLGVGSYNYVLNTTGGQNYSAVSSLDSDTLVVSKANPSPNMNISITPSNNVNYGTQTSATGSNTNSWDGDLTYSFFRDSVSVANPNIVTLNAGTYNYTYNTSGGANYTAGSVSVILTVNQLANNVNLLLNSQSGNLSLQYGQQLNASASSSSGVFSLYRNNTLVNSENSQNITLVAGFYEYFLNSSGNQNYFENNTGITKSVAIAKAASEVFLYLNNSRNNITIGQGNSLLINVTLNAGQGNVLLYVDSVLIYNGSSPLSTPVVFDSLGLFNATALYKGNQNYTSSFETFWVNVVDDSPPLVNITSPVPITYTSPNNIALNFLISDSSSIDKCWYNVNNGVNNSIAGCANTTFNVSGDGDYTLRFFSNDSLGNIGFKSVDFSIDSAGIFLLVIEPTGTKTARAGIPISYSALGNNLTCWYNVKTSVEGEIIGNTTFANCANSSFDVSSDGNYVFNLFANNSFGSNASTNSSFTVDTSAPPSGGSGDGGSSGGSGGSGGGGIISKKSIDAGSISDIVISQGGVKKISSWLVRNNGTSFLNDCRFKSQGEFASWITKTETKGLAAGEEYSFVFDINIPENIAEGEYGLEILLECSELKETTGFAIEVRGKQIDFRLINVERLEEGSVSVKYTMKELVGSDHNVNLQFLIFDLDNKKEAEVNEVKQISAGSESEFETIIPIREELKGELSLLVNLNSETYSAFVQENIVLGSGRATGLAIFGNEGTKDSFVSGLIIVLFVVFAFFIVKRIRKHKGVIRHQGFMKRQSLHFY